MQTVLCEVAVRTLNDKYFNHIFTPFEIYSSVSCLYMTGLSVEISETLGSLTSQIALENLSFKYIYHMTVSINNSTLNIVNYYVRNIVGKKNTRGQSTDFHSLADFENER